MLGKNNNIKICTETLAGLNNVHLIRFGVKISEKKKPFLLYYLTVES
jgi:hypothetical protein